MITILLILLVAIVILGWGLYRALPFGRVGILAWLQSLVLMGPWLLFFTLFAAGVYLNLAGVLLLLVLSGVLYMAIGNQLRAAGGVPSALRRVAPPGETAPDSVKVASEANIAQPKSDAAAAIASPNLSSSEPESVRIPAEDLDAIKGIFGLDTFFSTENIPYQNGAIFRGNLRGEVNSTYDRLSSKLKVVMGDRYRLFLLNGPDDRPVVVVLPSSNAPGSTTVQQWILAIVLLLLTVATTFIAAALLMGFDLLTTPQRWRETLPIVIGIVSILGLHELGHWVVASRYQVKLTPPFFIPTWQIGSFGAITRFESYLPHRTALFDISFAGPAAAGALSLTLLTSGLVLSQANSHFQIPSVYLQGSILVGTLARVILGDALQQSLVSIHPLTIIGWMGLVITAINLMPAGQLDGGRMVQAIYGRKTSGRITIATLILLGLASLVNPLALYWAIVILFLQRDLERPALNELAEVDDARAALGLLALFLMIVTLLPLTPALAGQLGIGGPL